MADRADLQESQDEPDQVGGRQEKHCETCLQEKEQQPFIATHVIKNQTMPYKSTLIYQRNLSLYTIDCSIKCNKNMQEILKVFHPSLTR